MTDTAIPATGEDVLAPPVGLDQGFDAPDVETFDSLNPRNGDVVGTYPVHGKEDIEQALAIAREASLWWRGLSFDERKDYLQTWKSVIVRRVAQLADVVHRETGKPHSDATLEAALAIDHLNWAATHAEKIMKRRQRMPGLVTANYAAYVEHRPLGVIGVIGPWNYPVFTPMGSIVYALAAGNAVVFKPSEYTPGVGVWLAKTFQEVVGEPVFQVVTGLGETGAALSGSAGIDKIAFTGSTATGKKIMKAAAEHLTPVLIEAGGKDPILVDEDADIDAAADAAIWGAAANAGQTCIGVERAYVHERVYDAFVAAVMDKARALDASNSAESKIGPITMPSQLEIIKDHITDAISKGGRALLGGPEAVGDRFVQPTVLVDVPEDSLAIQEETFGPTITITKVRDMDEAIEHANNTRYGLASTVFSKKRGMELAARIRSGMTAVNAVIAFAAIPSLPFGGVGDSGFGRIHGEEGLKEFTYAKAIARERFASAIPLTTFRRSASNDQQLMTILTALHGSKQTLPKP